MAKKGQMAMEYLATYGWALFAMFAVISILVASGLFGAGRYSADECRFAPNLPCNYAYITEPPSGTVGADISLFLNMTNTQGFPMLITNCYYKLDNGILAEKKCNEKDRIIKQGEWFSLGTILTGNTQKIKANEIHKVYVTFTFRNCQDAKGDTEEKLLADCKNNAPAHNTSGVVIATVRAGPQARGP